MKHLRSIEEIFDYAIERENEANALYKRLAPLVEKAEVRAAIENFAADEYQHRVRLEGIRDGDITFTDEEIGNLNLAGCLDNLKPRTNMTYTELLAFAIKKEDKSHRLYTQLAQCTSKKDVKELFTQLAREEAQHRFSLEFEYDLASF